MTHITDQNTDSFKSYDLGLVACLLSRGFNLLKLERSQTGRALFIVEEHEGLQQTIESYWAFECAVDAQTYFNQLKRLKNQIYSLS